MDSEFRQLFTDQAQDADILDNNRINTCITDEMQIFTNVFKFTVFDQCVHGHISPDPAHMSVINSLFKFLVREIISRLPGAKKCSPEINGIGSILDRCNKRFYAADGG